MAKQQMKHATKAPAARLLVYVGAARKRSSGQQKRCKILALVASGSILIQTKHVVYARKNDDFFFELGGHISCPQREPKSFRRLFAALTTTFRGGARDEQTEITVLDESGSIPIQRQSVVPGGNGSRRVYF